MVFGLLFAVSVVAWSATALTFGRIPALASALLLLVYPAWATLYHQASSDAVFATGLSLWALVLARALRRPSAGRFAALGAGIAILILIRPANQVLLPAIFVPLLATAPWRRRLTWVAVCLAAAVLPLAGWAVHNGVRYDDYTVARGGRAWVPFLRVWLDDRTVAPENGPGSRRLADLIEHRVLTEEPFASLHVPLGAYLQNGSNYETVRLIALSDKFVGRDTNYEVIFDSAIEAIKAHPRTYVRGVADVFWQFLVQAPLREGVVPRAQTAPEPPPPTYTRDGVVLPNPQATVLLDAVPYRVRLVRRGLHRLVHRPGPIGHLELPERPGALPGGRRAGAGVGRGASVPRRRGVGHGDPQPHHAAFPTSSALAPRGRRSSRLAAPLRVADDRRALGGGRGRAPHPCGLAGDRPRVRLAAVPRVHRHRAGGARG